MDTIELKVMRRQLDAFIQADPRTIVFTRQTKVDSGAGGWVQGPEVHTNPQQFRLVPFKRRLTQQEQNTQDGDVPLIPYVLVGYWNSDVERDDLFTLSGIYYEVIGVEPKIASDRSQADRVVCELEVRS